MAAGLERNGRTRVQAIFSHAAGDNSTLLSFNEGDVITLLVPEARDGWHYGENEKNRMYEEWTPLEGALVAWLKLQIKTCIVFSIQAGLVSVLVHEGAR